MTIADQLVAAVEQLAELDFKTVPSIIFLGELRYRLITHNFSGEDAELICSRLDVSLPPGSVTPDQIVVMADAFMRTIEKMKEALVEQGFKHPVACIAQMASKMHITMS